MTGKDDNTSLPVYTFAEVAKHNTENSCWCVVRGRVLDLTTFLKRHPGGSQIILASGIDATILVDSYHPTGVPSAILDKLTIGRVEKSVSYYCMDDAPDAFYPTLKRKVHEHLKQLGVERRGSWEIHVKAAVIFFFLISSYVCGWLLSYESLWLRALFAVVHGVAAAHVGMSVMHDANHAAFSKRSKVNSVLGATLDLIGASGCVWSFQHVVSHHAFTNLETQTETNLSKHRNLMGDEKTSDLDAQLSHENDVDVFSSYPMVRMHPADARSWYHKYQHIYAPLLFGAFTLVKIFYSDVQFYFAGRVAHVSMYPRLSKAREHLVFLGLKVVNLTLMIGIPYYLHGAQTAALLLLVAHFVAGEYLAICFIVSHISEAALFYRGGQELGLKGSDVAADVTSADGKPNVHPRDWAALQARSTVNWASESWFWGAFSGGLNTQFEHHVFPGVNHTAYRFMPPIVRQVCKDFGVTYCEVPNLAGAILLCMRYLRALGQEDNPETGPSKAVTGA